MIDKNTIIGKEDDGTDITLEKLQLRLKSMLKDVVAVFNSNNIRYFAAEGTLLGAIRHSDIIPWDDDIDLGFYLDDYKKIVEVLNNNLEKKYVIQCFETDSNYSVTQPIIKVRLKNTYVEYDAWYDRNHCDSSGIFIDLIAFSNCSANDDFFIRKTSFFRTLFLLLFNYLNINVISLKKRHINIAYKYNKKYNNSSMIGYALNYMSWKNIKFNKTDFEELVDMKFDDFMIKVPIGYDNILKSIYGDYNKLPDNNKIRLYHSKNIKLKSPKK